MLISTDITPDYVPESTELQDRMEKFYTYSGIHHLSSFPYQGKISLKSPNILEADIRVQSETYNYAYLPDEDVIEALLYPIFISRWFVSSTHYTKRSGWKNYELIYTHAGSGILNMDNQVYYLSPDTLCLLDCRPFHYYFATDDGGWEYSFIHFFGPSADFLCEKIIENGVVFNNLKNTALKQKYDALAILAEENPADFDLRFHLDLTSLLVELACSDPEKPETVIPEWLSLIQSFILENYNKNWSIRELAEQSCFSESRFSHVFKESIGCSPVEYRDYLRIEHAKEYLTTTAMTMDQIAEQTGFGALPGFYSAFRRRTGLTPGRYRRQNQLQAKARTDQPENSAEKETPV